MSRNKTVFLISTLFMLLSACQSGVSPTAEATSSSTPNITNDAVKKNLSNQEFTLEVIEDDTSMIAPLPSNTPYAVGIKTAFPPPTLTPFQYQMLYQKLDDENCLLPCYLGIVPNEISIDEAKIILEELGATLSYGSPYDIREDLENYIYYFDIVVDNNLLVQHTIYLDVQQNELLEFRVDIDQRESDIFYEYWSRYSLQNMLINLGFPDISYIDIGNFETYPGYSFMFIYEEQEIYYTIYGQKQDGLVCPLFKEGIIGLIQIRIIDSDYDEGLAWIPSTYDRTIQEVFEISDQQFYEQVLSDPETCFEPNFVNP